MTAKSFNFWEKRLLLLILNGIISKTKKMILILHLLKTINKD